MKRIFIIGLIALTTTLFGVDPVVKNSDGRMYSSDVENLIKEIKTIYGSLWIIQDTGIAGKTVLFQVVDSALYNRFLVTSHGLVVAGRQHNQIVDVDGLAMLGAHNSLDGKNSMSIGYYAFNKGDTSFVFGSFIDSTAQNNKITIGSGVSATQLLSNTTENSLAFGANETTPGLLLTTGKVTLQSVLNSKPRESAPTSPAEGDIYVNSTDFHIYCYLNGVWKQLD